MISKKVLLIVVLLQISLISTGQINLDSLVENSLDVLIHENQVEDFCCYRFIKSSYDSASLNKKYLDRVKFFEEMFNSSRQSIYRIDSVNPLNDIKTSSILPKCVKLRNKTGSKEDGILKIYSIQSFRYNEYSYLLYSFLGKRLSIELLFRYKSGEPTFFSYISGIM